MTALGCTKITGIGNTLVDVLINETDQFLEELGKAKGGMTLVEYEEIETILSRTRKTPSIVPGGAACNTIVGVANLGGESCFIGCRGDDDHGRIFEKELLQCSVKPIMSIGTSPTGNALSVVTPDAQRSMFTYLGASAELSPESINPEMFNETGIAVIEGYLLFNPDLMMASLHAAKEAGAMIALDLASFEVVNASKEILENIVREYVDILIANEDEARAYTGHEEEAPALEKLSEHVSYAVLKVGSRGSYVSHQENTIRIHPQTGNDPVDTTGAGDLWAAGFLYGLANGLSIEKSGELGSACGYEVCQVMGAQIPADGWKRIKALL